MENKFVLGLTFASQGSSSRLEIVSGV